MPRRARGARTNPRRGEYDDRSVRDVIEAIIVRHQKMPNSGGWMERNIDAWRHPKAGAERALVTMVNGWAEYADAHRERFGSTIGDDGVLGPAWEEIARGLRSLLNGEIGRLDGGFMDSILYDAAASQGVNLD